MNFDPRDETIAMAKPARGERKTPFPKEVRHAMQGYGVKSRIAENHLHFRSAGGVALHNGVDILPKQFECAAGISEERAHNHAESCFKENRGNTHVPPDDSPMIAQFA